MIAVDVTPLGFVTRIPFAPGPLVVVAGTAVWYLRSVRRLDAASRPDTSRPDTSRPDTSRPDLAADGPWPIGRTAAFLAGLAVLAVATLSGLASWEQTDFTVHGTIDMLVAMVAPIGLALGAPLTLAEQAGGPRLRRAVTTALGSRAAAVLFRPVSAWIIFAGSLFVQYYSTYFRASRPHESLLQLGHLELLLAGCVFVWPLMGADPIPRRVHPGWRIASLMLMLPFYTVFGMGLESMTRGAAPGITGADMHGAGGVIWSAGSVIGIAGALGVLYYWLFSEERRARHNDDLDDDVLEAQAAVWRVSRLLAERETAAIADRRLAARAATPASARLAGSQVTSDSAGTLAPPGVAAPREP